MALTDEDFLAAVQRDGQAMADAAEGHLDQPIPSIDGWTVADVIAHNGSGNHWVMGMLEGLTGRESLARLEDPPSGDALLPWYRQTEVDLHAALVAIPAGARGSTLQGKDEPLTFWRRRRAQENAVHRWDVESAGGSPDVIDPALAADGVDEMFEVFVPRFRDDRLVGGGETIHLHATDDGLGEAGEWMVTLGADGLTWEHGHGKGDVAAKGTASDLLLFLWGRVPPARLEVFGDAGLLDAWQEKVQI